MRQKLARGNWHHRPKFPPPQRQSMMLEVMHRHEKLAPESGMKFMATVSGACVRSLRWRGGTNGKAQDLQLANRGFDCQPATAAL